MPRVVLSAEGRRELEQELERLAAERPRIAEQIGAAREQGSDPVENLDLRDAMENLMAVEGRLIELRALLATAEPLAAVQLSGVGAQLGATVTMRLPDGEEATYVLVLPAEAAPRRGRLSVESPVGRALLGATPGNHVVAQTPSGPEQLEILHVS